MCFSRPIRGDDMNESYRERFHIYRSKIHEGGPESRPDIRHRITFLIQNQTYLKGPKSSERENRRASVSKRFELLATEYLSKKAREGSEHIVF